MKTCSKCKEDKPESEFGPAGPSSRAKDGLYCYCRDCTRSIKNKWNKDNRDKIWRSRILKVYGLDSDALDQLLDRARGKCECCGCDLVFGPAVTESGQVACIDHCHKSGKVRGLLCRNCNLAIGFMSDSTEKLAGAISYLEANHGS